MEIRLSKGIPDKYDRYARLYPALLVALPIIAASISVASLKDMWTPSVVAFVSSLGVLYLVSSMARDAGKAVEERLFAKWNGMPTTEIQRHSDRRIDTHTKERYHRILAQGLAKAYPTAPEELANAAACDDLYRAGATWLRQQTRDTEKFNLLYLANVSFGYKRNAYGLRWVGFGVTILTAVLVIALNGFVLLTPPFVSIERLSSASPAAIFDLIVCVAMMVVWLFYFTERTVRLAGVTYAERLIEACDALPSSQPYFASTPVGAP